MPAYRKDRYKMAAFEYMDAAGGDVEQACQYAITAAEERSRLFALPCTWAARLSEDGSEIIVTRTRRAQSQSSTTYLYVVTVFTPGYLPETEPAFFRSKREASQHAKWEADQYRDDGYRVTGNMRDGYQIMTPGLDTVIEINAQPYSLAEAAEILAGEAS